MAPFLTPYIANDQRLASNCLSISLTTFPFFGGGRVFGGARKIITIKKINSHNLEI